MICVETQHFNLNRILLLAIGLWPYEKSKFRKLQATLCFGILTSFVIFQLTALIIANCTADYVKIFSSATFFNICILNYNMFWINGHHVKNMLQQLQCFCNELKDENEFAILKKYGHYFRQFTIILIVMAICWLFIITFVPIWPQIFGSVLYINESQLQSQKIQIMTEYFIDQEKYFYLIMLHINAAICIGVTTLVGTGTLLLGCIIHICGLLTITSYRVEQITTKTSKNIKNQTMIYNKKIFYAVEIHYKIIKFCECLCSNFKGSFFLLLITTVSSLSLNLFGTFQNASLGDNKGFLLHLLLSFAIILFMFLVNYFGQEMINHNNHVYFTAYNSQWYNASLHAQKMILFILLRSSKDCNLNIGGMFVASFECFSSLIKTAVSYFTVMYSIEE
ncbi:odorant receptor 4-like [Cataglyphis hispanica]|uniref:odorant receptor 4-like n=1 Tax=Cataglyphis hispanica TaxID=1086592 RepID=UPI0021804DD1|nr:odorant receptor 4-like [Cataglyphis hispanica]